jgi:hypothetical protein
MLKIDGTNRRNPLESTDVSKNKPKTKSKQTQNKLVLSAKKANQS